MPPATVDPISLARAGDADAWMALLATHGPAVYGLCRRLTHDPDDAYQDVWEKVHRCLGQFDPDRTGSFRGWLLTLAHRHLIDRHRRTQTRTFELPVDLPLAEPGADAVIARQQRWSRVEEALHHLPLVDRRALILHHIEDRNLDEIARMEEVPIGTVKSRLHRARCRLIEMLGGHHDD